MTTFIEVKGQKNHFDSYIMCFKFTEDSAIFKLWIKHLLNHLF